jgi:hypothetical protein
MKKIIFYLLLLFAFYNLQAQNCSDNFNYLTKRISKYYVDYADPVAKSFHAIKRPLDNEGITS